MATDTAPPGTHITTTTLGPGGRSRGRGLIADRDFQPGDLIATFSDPILALPDGPGMRITCNWCLTTGQDVQLRACTGCKAAVYCSPSCQRAHWKSGVHKAECKMFARIRSTTGKEWLPTPSRAVAQILFLLRAGDDRTVKAFGKDGSLEGNVAGFKSDADLWRDFELQAMASIVYGGMVESEEMLETAKEVLCKIHTNAFDRLERATGSSGIYLHPVLAMVNHSCVPNAFVMFEGRNAYLRAETHINAGDEVEICYVDNLVPRGARQQALRLYHFECSCPRCKDDLDVYEVCETSPTIPLNVLSLQPDLTKYNNPPIDGSKEVPRAKVETIYTAFHSPALQRGNDPLIIARQRWKVCKPLVEAKMWAVEPLPSSIIELATIYEQDAPKSFPYAITLWSFLAVESDPYAFVTPFLPQRVNGFMAIAKLLAGIGELTATGKLKDVCKHSGVVDILEKANQPSMCEAMVRLVIHHGWVGAPEDWGVLRIAKKMLQEIEMVEGRKQDSALLQRWIMDPKDSEASAYFQQTVLEPVNQLAALAIEIVNAELGASRV